MSPPCLLTISTYLSIQIKHLVSDSFHLPATEQFHIVYPLLHAIIFINLLLTENPTQNGTIIYHCLLVPTKSLL